MLEFAFDPSPEVIDKFCQRSKHKAAKWIKSKEGWSVYWPAELYTHAEMAGMVGFDEYEKGIAVPTEKTGRGGLQSTDVLSALSLDAMKNIAFMAVRLYAETHPRPSQVTQKQAAEMLGISESTMSKLVKSGKIGLNKTGQIPISEIDRALTVASR